MSTTNIEKTTSRAALREELVVANHILFNERIVDGYGHVSVRNPDRSDRFYLSRNVAPATVTADDIMEFDLDGKAIEDNRKAYLERFIHSEIYRARNDINSVVHSHSPSVIPFGVVKAVKLQPICHMCGFIGSATPVFEIRSFAGDASDLLITDPNLGVNLATVLGQNSVVLMRGHGSTVVGRNLREAVFRAIYTELNARLQSEAMQLGDVNYLTAGEAESTTKTNSTVVNRAWDLWKMRVHK